VQRRLRKLSDLAEDADLIRRGERQNLRVTEGADEIASIGATMQQLVSHLQTEKQALMTLNAALDQRVLDRTKQIEQMAAETRLAAVGRERMRLARELHDTLAHSLSALAIQLRMIRKLQSTFTSTQLQEEISRAESIAVEGLKNTRDAIAHMRFHSVRESGLGAALQDLMKRFGERSGIKIDVALSGPALDWNDERAEALCRIIEEGLINIERHAGAHLARLLLHMLPNESLELMLEDDGRGFDANQIYGGHYGLVGMREQARLLGAKLEFLALAEGGTRLLLQMPI
jgi:signal transduction histidine kinase